MSVQGGCPFDTIFVLGICSNEWIVLPFKINTSFFLSKIPIGNFLFKKIIRDTMLLYLFIN